MKVQVWLPQKSEFFCPHVESFSSKKNLSSIKVFGLKMGSIYSVLSKQELYEVDELLMF